jgi:anti-sigma regulatory factor (Ser/Thr protein kinase)
MKSQAVELQFSHPARPAAIGRARRDVEDALAASGIDGRTAGDLLLLVSELVTNAVRHARTERFEVRLAVGPDAVRLEVHDDGAGFEPRIRPSQDGGGGYGLFIVDRIADRWGVARDGRGAIWLELDRR